MRIDIFKVFWQCYFNINAEIYFLKFTLFNLILFFYIMRKTGLDEAQAGIKIGERNINNLRYTDDTTLMAESEELRFS